MHSMLSSTVTGRSHTTSTPHRLTPNALFWLFVTAFKKPATSILWSCRLFCKLEIAFERFSYFLSGLSKTRSRPFIMFSSCTSLRFTSSRRSSTKLYNLARFVIMRPNIALCDSTRLFVRDSSWNTDMATGPSCDIQTKHVYTLLVYMYYSRTNNSKQK